MKTALIIASIALTAAPVAHAGSDVSVRFDRELLLTQSGTERVYKRLDRVSRRHCRGMTRQRVSDHRICSEDLLAQLVDQVDHYRLTALHKDEQALRYAEYN